MFLWSSKEIYPQVIPVIEDTSKGIFLLSEQKHVVTPHLNCDEMVLMRSQNVCFYGAVRKIIPKLSLFPLLIWTT